MIAGVPKESFPQEQRVSIVPGSLSALKKIGVEVLVESGAGYLAGYTDAEYSEKGAEVVSRADVFSRSDIVLQVRGLGSNPTGYANDLALMRKGQMMIAYLEPLVEFDALRAGSQAGVTALSMELMPRITRAQSMDALSSMATIAGYKAVLMAADHLPKMFPMLMTAAGTLAPAKAFIIGAGVAGLQAIASAKRLGAVVTAYDVRPAVKEQIHSLGATFLELPLESSDSEDKGGYAKEQSEDFIKKQQAMMSDAIAASDVVITTALIPGKDAPILVTKEMVARMAPGSVVVDIAAERGGNCELTKPGETISVNGVTICGPLNLGSTIPFHASQMYARNMTTFLTHLVKEGKIDLERDDEILAGTLVLKDGAVVHSRVKELMGA